MDSWGSRKMQGARPAAAAFLQALLFAAVAPSSLAVDVIETIPVCLPGHNCANALLEIADRIRAGEDPSVVAAKHPHLAEKLQRGAPPGVYGPLQPDGFVEPLYLQVPNLGSTNTEYKLGTLTKGGAMDFMPCVTFRPVGPSGWKQAFSVIADIVFVWGDRCGGAGASRGTAVMMGVLYYLRFSAAKATDVSTFKCDRIETLPLRVAATGRSLYASPSMFGAAFRWLGKFNGRVPESTTAIRVEAREPEPALFDEDQCNAGEEGDIDVSSACCELHARRFREWAAQAPSSLDGPWGSTVGELAVEILRRTKQPEFTEDVCDGPTDEDPTGTLPLVETFEAAVRQPAGGGVQTCRRSTP